MANNANKLPMLSGLFNYKPSKRMEPMSSVNTNLTFANSNANVNAENNNKKANKLASNADGIYDLK